MNLIELERAKQIVLEYLNQEYMPEGVELVIVEKQTQEKPYGWVFFYNTRQFLETGDWRDGAVGNGPIIVTRADGNIHPLSSQLDSATMISGFEEKHGFD